MVLIDIGNAMFIYIIVVRNYCSSTFITDAVFTRRTNNELFAASSAIVS